VCMTARLDVTPKTTEHNQIVRTGKSEAEVTNNKKKLRSRYALLMLTTDRHKAIARPLCDSRATCIMRPLRYDRRSRLSGVVVFSSWSYVRYQTCEHESTEFRANWLEWKFTGQGMKRSTLRIRRSKVDKVTQDRH